MNIRFCTWGEINNKRITRFQNIYVKRKTNILKPRNTKGKLKLSNSKKICKFFFNSVNFVGNCFIPSFFFIIDYLFCWKTIKNCIQKNILLFIWVPFKIKLHKRLQVFQDQKFLFRVGTNIFLKSVSLLNYLNSNLFGIIFRNELRNFSLKLKLFNKM